MRFRIFAGASAALLLAVAGLVHHPHDVPPPPQETTAVAPPAGAIAAGEGSSAPRESPVRVAEAAPLSDLPLREVPQRPVHTIDDRDLPSGAAPITVKDRNGRVITRLVSRASPPPKPAAAPAASATASAGGGARPQALAGRAQPNGATSLAVGGTAVRLFGVRPAESRDRCGDGQGGWRACGEMARDALARRLAGDAAVSCQLTPGVAGGETAAVCHDSRGVDLGGFLVAEGYALADPAHGQQYLDAQGLAHAYRRGLWRYR